jgi:hypothetical protein
MSMPEMKVCATCGEPKQLGDYPVRENGRIRAHCRGCYNAYRRGSKSLVAAASGPAPTAPRVRHVEEPIEVIDEHRLKKRVRELEEQNRNLLAELSAGGDYHEVVREVLARQHKAPAAQIRPRERKSKTLEATPLVLASDWHVEEEVLAQSVAGRNRYNLEIATRRMERFFEAYRWGVNHQRHVFKIRDSILWLGGDFITNFLHDDDAETNGLAPLDAILFAQKNIIKGLEYLLEDPEIEQFTIPCNDGNHGRDGGKRMRNATRPQHSLEVFMYAQIAQYFRNEPRLKFILPTSQLTFLDDVYGKTIRFLHGDVFKFAGGVGGITVPLFRSLARWESVKRADLTCMGHWHQRISLWNLMVNGSLIGFNSYAMGGGFAFEAPVQSMRMLVPGRFVASDIPMFVSDREDDIANNRRTA